MAEFGFGGSGQHHSVLGSGEAQSTDSFYLTGATTTLDEDLYCRNLHVANNSVLVTNGYRIFARGDVRVYNEGLITNGGGTGATGAAGVGGAKGVTPTTRMVGGGSHGGKGGDTGLIGDLGAPITAISLGGDGGTGGGSDAHVGTAGGACTYTESAMGAILQPSSYLLGGVFGQPTVVDPIWSDANGLVRFRGGSGGGGGSGGAGFAGGGGGAGGGVVYIAASNVFVDDGAAIMSRGGYGGHAQSVGAGGGGGGGGGVILIYAGRVYLEGELSRLDVDGGPLGSGGGTGGVDGLPGDEGRVMIMSPHGTFVAKASINGTEVIPPR